MEACCAAKPSHNLGGLVTVDQVLRCYNRNRKLLYRFDGSIDDVVLTTSPGCTRLESALCLVRLGLRIALVWD